MNQIRREFVSLLVRQLNDTVDYERQTNRWMCLLLSPMLTLAIVAFVPGAFVTPTFALFCVAYLFAYVRLASESVELTQECIDKVLRRRPEMRAELLSSTGQEWADVDEPWMVGRELNFGH